MTRKLSLSDVTFGPRGTVSDKELKKLYKASSGNIKKSIKAEAPKLKFLGVWSQVRSSFPSFFQISMEDLLFYGWNKFSQVGKAMFPAEANADSRVNVPLHNYKFISRHEPHIDLYYQGQNICNLPLNLDITLDFDSIMLVFMQGKLIEIQPGTCKGTARLSYNSRTIIDKRIASFKWPGRLDINHHQEKTNEPNVKDISITSNINKPGLPTPRKKRGCGCFLFLVLLFGLAGALIASGISYPDSMSQLLNELLGVFQSIYSVIYRFIYDLVY